MPAACWCVNVGDVFSNTAGPSHPARSRQANALAGPQSLLLLGACGAAFHHHTAPFRPHGAVKSACLRCWVNAGEGRDSQPLKLALHCVCVPVVAFRTAFGLCNAVSQASGSALQCCLTTILTPSPTPGVQRLFLEIAWISSFAVVSSGLKWLVAQGAGQARRFPSKATPRVFDQCSLCPAPSCPLPNQV